MEATGGLEVAAAATRAEPRPMPGAAARERDAPLDRRQLVGMRVMEENRRAGAGGRVLRDAESRLRWLDEPIGRIDRELGERIRSSPARREKDDLLRGRPVLSRTLLARLPELGQVSHHRVAARWWDWPRWPTTAGGTGAPGGSSGAGGR